MAVTVYKSTDASAPALTDVAGSLVALLDAILVNGYGSKAAAGWTIAFTATNKRAYRQGASPSFYFRVDNTSGPGTNKAVIGYESMTDIDIGTGPLGSGSFFGVSSNQRWVCVADNKTFYLFNWRSDTPGTYNSLAYGNFTSFKSGDAYPVGLYAADSLAAVASWFLADTYEEDLRGLLQRNHAGVAGQVNACVVAGTAVKGGGTASSGQAYNGVIPYPHPVDNGLWLAPVIVCELGQHIIRGRLRGIWRPLHTLTGFADWDTFSGSGVLAGKTFIVITAVNNSTPAGTLVIETSDTWTA